MVRHIAQSLTHTNTVVVENKTHCILIFSVRLEKNESLLCFTHLLPPRSKCSERGYPAPSSFPWCFNDDTFWPKEGLAAASNEEAEKLRGLSNEAIADIVRNDVVKGQFLTNGVLTRSIYDESATFTDEIDTYGLDQWMRGTQKLFDGTQSKVDLVGDVKASSQEVEFRFSEILAFNIPFKPKVTLTGKVSLTRGKDGLITHYQEYWDQSVKEVLLSAKFN